MTSYSYPHPSAIEKIILKQAPNGTPRAYLCAAENASIEDLQSIATTLSEQGYFAIHSVCDGRAALEVRGYLWERDIPKLMEERGWAQGEPAIVKDAETKKSIIQTIRDKSLTGVSLSFLAADVSYATYGYRSARPEDMLAGISYGLGSASMGLLGTDAQAMKEIRHHAKKLATYAKDHHLDLSRNTTLPVITEGNKRSTFQGVLDTLQSYPGEIGNSFTSLAGTLIAYSAWKYRVGPNIKRGIATLSHADKVAHSSGKKDIGLGLMTLTSGLIGALVKEKRHDPDAPPATGLNAVWEWVQEKPLRVAGFGYMISTLCHTLSTIQEHNHAKMIGDKETLSTVKFRAGFIAFTLIGELLMLISSKGHGEGVKSDPSTDESVISIAAEMIAQQRPSDQAALIDNIGSFLGRPDVLGGKDEEVKQKLAAQVEAMQRNPWIKALEGAKAQTPASAPLAEPQAWQAKMASAQPAPPVLGA